MSDTAVASSTFLVTLAIDADEWDGNQIDLSCLVGLGGADLDDLRAGLLGKARVSIRPGEVGKGASGPGVTLVIETLERITSDGASLIAWGTLLLGAIRKLRQRKERRLNLDDGRTVAAMTAAQMPPPLRERLAGASFLESTCLTSAETSPDSRDVWASTFMTDDRWLLMLFSSPTGLVLGHAAIPSEWDGENVRTAQQVRILFEQARQA